MLKVNVTPINPINKRLKSVKCSYLSCSDTIKKEYFPAFYEKNQQDNQLKKNFRLCITKQ